MRAFLAAMALMTREARQFTPLHRLHCTGHPGKDAPAYHSTRPRVSGDSNVDGLPVQVYNLVRVNGRADEPRCEPA
jgi:hypothetical protein